MNGLERICSICHRKITVGKPFQFFGRLGPKRSYACNTCVRRTLTIVKMYQEEYNLFAADLDELKEHLGEQCP